MAHHVREHLVFALDVDTWGEAERWVDRMAPYFATFKVGLELFVSAGPEAVRKLTGRGVPVFLDLKLHDIPTTVEGAARAAGRLGVRMLTVHAAGGARMLRAAVDGAGPEVCVLGVTRLTSVATTTDEVADLARQSIEVGCGGVVCAGPEVEAVRRTVGSAAAIVCPGTRPAGAARSDQVRVATPEEALRAGASHIVVGRAVREAPDPEATARALVSSLEAALSS